MKKTVEKASFVLKDYENNDKKTKVEVAIGENGGLLIRPEGYGDCYSKDGEGTPILLDFHEGKMYLYVWSEINRENPTHVIDLSPALEKNYEGQERS